MNSRIYPKELFQREISRIRIIGEFGCPNCFSSDITDISLYYVKCKRCQSKFDFKKLLNKTQVRDKKIEQILS